MVSSGAPRAPALPTHSRHWLPSPAGPALATEPNRSTRIRAKVLASIENQNARRVRLSLTANDRRENARDADRCSSRSCLQTNTSRGRGFMRLASLWRPRPDAVCACESKYVFSSTGAERVDDFKCKAKASTLPISTKERISTKRLGG